MASASVQQRLTFPVRKSYPRSVKAKENISTCEVKICSSPKRKLFTEGHVESSPEKRKKDVNASPSTLLSGLKVTTKKLTPVQLFPPNVNSYKLARRALHSGMPERLQCREKEVSTLNEFLQKTIKKNKPGSLYISGPPGTGKTASLTKVLEKIDNKECEHVWINCMALKSTSAIYEEIGRGFNIKFPNTVERAMQTSLEELFTSKGKMLLVILDELDQLSSKYQSTLYSLFEYPALEGSRLVLVGISNALDLTDRLLPRLQAKLMAKSRPQLLNFAPYTKQQLVTIINERLSEACTESNEVVIKPAAVQLLSVKIASVAGDARKALDIARRAIDIAEGEARKQTTLRATSDDGSNPNSPRKNRPGAPVKCVDPVLIMKVFNQVYGSYVTSDQISGSNDDGFPVQQKLLLCALLVFTKFSKQREPTVGKMHGVYGQICKRRNITPVDQSEFWSLCELLESRGFLNVKKNKSEVRMSKVSLRVDEQEISSVLQDKTLVASIMDEARTLKL
ncbi:cell division control protein 6 homolog [Artemia franciscana]|uniref:Cell division control protein n=1 Tax=Artemia franciscana TaxID=6661 RepID=A0AA88I644_ARTSF|nr:hypothetical protein QYM36_002509 [Artemia franciscana]